MGEDASRNTLHFWEVPTRFGLLKRPVTFKLIRMGTYGSDIQKAIVAQIRAELAANGITQSDLAERTGMPTSTMSRYLSVKSGRDIPLPAFADISRALGLSMTELAARAQRRLEGQGAI